MDDAVRRSTFLREFQTKVGEAEKRLSHIREEIEHRIDSECRYRSTLIQIIFYKETSFTEIGINNSAYLILVCSYGLSAVG